MEGPNQRSRISDGMDFVFDSLMFTDLSFLYVGGLPDSLPDSVPHVVNGGRGFIGCIGGLAINDRIVDLQNPLEKVCVLAGQFLNVFM